MTATTPARVGPWRHPRRWAAAGVAVGMLLSAGCAARTAIAPPPSTTEPSRAGDPARAGRPATAPVERLGAALDGLFGTEALAHAHIGVLVRSLHTGETLYARNERQLLVPASNQKLLTAAVAARRLGWDYRYTTRILATGPVHADGTLDGDLVIVGSGDPTINPRHPDRWAVLDEWAARIAARGVRIVRGHLVGDDRAFAEPGWGSGWSWDDLSAGYGAPIGGLQYHENQVELMVGPGLAPGTPGVIAMAPYGSGLLVDNQVTTVAADQPTRLAATRTPGTIFLTVSGQVALASRPRTLLAAVDNPTRLFVNAFREALARQGVVIGGSALDIGEMREPPDTSAAATWVEDRSAPLYEIVRELLLWSRNDYGETLLWSLSPPGAPASEAAGLAVLRQALLDMGLPPDSFGAFDGSGLSRYDMVSATALVHLLEAMWREPAWLGPFRAALPVAGQSGSLQNRMRGTAADGRVWAKTGSMFNIRSVAGYVVTADEEPLAVAMLANNYLVPSADIDRMMDDALAALAAFARR